MKGEIKRNNSKIHRTMLKYGIDSFTLEIMEYCSSNILIEREPFYLDNIKPLYNILTIAGSRNGFVHSEATKELQRAYKLSMKQKKDLEQSCLATYKYSTLYTQAKLYIVSSNILVVK